MDYGSGLSGVGLSKPTAPAAFTSFKPIPDQPPAAIGMPPFEGIKVPESKLPDGKGGGGGGGGDKGGMAGGGGGGGGNQQAAAGEGEKKKEKKEGEGEGEGEGEEGEGEKGKGKEAQGGQGQQRGGQNRAQSSQQGTGQGTQRPVSDQVALALETEKQKTRALLNQVDVLGNELSQAQKKIKAGRDATAATDKIRQGLDLRKTNPEAGAKLIKEGQADFEKLARGTEDEAGAARTAGEQFLKDKTVGEELRKFNEEQEKQRKAPPTSFASTTSSGNATSSTATQ